MAIHVPSGVSCALTTMNLESGVKRNAVRKPEFKYILCYYVHGAASVNRNKLATRRRKLSAT